VHGEDDVSTRPYRQGDDLRKVHWRSTARTGELMVRLEERPWRSQATLLLDTRQRAHLVAPRRGGAAAPVVVPGDDAPPTDSLEWLVEAAAGIGTALARRGSVLRVVTDAGDLAPGEGHISLSPDQLLDQLAGVTASAVSGLETGIERVCRVAGDGPLVCLLGAIGPDDAVELVRARSGPATDVAVLVDLGSWADAGATRGRRAISAASRAELDKQRDDAAELLRAAGWQVAVARADTTLAELWRELGRLSVAGGPVRTPA
jgi:uncharacterized protein (DUF58 family)